MNEQQLKEIESRAKRADEENAKLTEGFYKRENHWRMCIPRRDDDSDAIFAAATDDIRVLLAEVRRLQIIETRAATINNALLDVISSMMPFLTLDVQGRMQQALQPVIDLMEQKP